MAIRRSSTLPVTASPGRNSRSTRACAVPVPQPHLGAPALRHHLDAPPVLDRVVGVDLDAEEVVAGELRLDPLEHPARIADDAEELAARPPRRLRQAHLAQPEVLGMGRPPPRGLRVQPRIERYRLARHQSEERRARLRRELLDGNEPGGRLVDHEPARDPDDRLRPLDRAQIAQQALNRAAGDDRSVPHFLHHAVHPGVQPRRDPSAAIRVVTHGPGICSPSPPAADSRLAAAPTGTPRRCRSWEQTSGPG